MRLSQTVAETLDERSGDRPCSVQLSEPERIGAGFRNFDRFSISKRGRRGEIMYFDRDVLRSGAVVGVLPVDFEREEIVLTRQFRLGGHLAANRGEMVEIVAGRVDHGERPEEAARRECFEEIGAQPQKLRRLFDFAPAPALSDEFMTLFLAHIDASQASIWAGMPHEHEEIAVNRYSFAEAIEFLETAALYSGPTIVALQWFSRNLASLRREPDATGN